jgi:hypothetical protein
MIVEMDMSWLKRLFGGGGGGTEAESHASREYKGYLITATPLKEGGQYRLAGVISRDIDGVRNEHRFIRADQFTSKDDAVQFAFAKGELIVDQSGAAMFD